MEIRKISHRCSRSVDHAELGHFTLLFCRWQKAFVLLIKPCLVTFSLPPSSWFMLKLPIYVLISACSHCQHETHNDITSFLCRYVASVKKALESVILRENQATSIRSPRVLCNSGRVAEQDSVRSFCFLFYFCTKCNK